MIWSSRVNSIENKNKNKPHAKPNQKPHCVHMTQNTAQERIHIISLNLLKYTDNPTLYQQDLCQSLYCLPVLFKVCDGSAILSPLRARIGLVEKHKTSIDSMVCALVSLTEMMCDKVWASWVIWQGFDLRETQERRMQTLWSWAKAENFHRLNSNPWAGDSVIHQKSFGCAPNIVASTCS